MTRLSFSLCHPSTEPRLLTSTLNWRSPVIASCDFECNGDCSPTSPVELPLSRTFLRSQRSQLLALRTDSSSSIRIDLRPPGASTYRKIKILLFGMSGNLGRTRESWEPKLASSALKVSLRRVQSPWIGRT